MKSFGPSPDWAAGVWLANFKSPARKKEGSKVIWEKGRKEREKRRA